MKMKEKTLALGLGATYQLAGSFIKNCRAQNEL